MKKLLLLSLSILVLGSCSQDENYDTETADLTAPIVDITAMLPNRTLDTSERGTYSGVITADDTNFHGRIYLNLGNNDNKNEAVVISDKGDKLVFGLKGQTGSTYSFAGDRGSFDVDVSDISLVNTTNVIIDNTEGQVRLRKETNGTKNVIVLGTFDDELSILFGFPQAFTGTWDFMVDGGTAPFISEVVYTTAGGTMASDFAVDMEEGDSGCSFGITKPRHEVDAGAGLWELISVNQITFNPNTILVYDFTFSKGLLDANAITDYTLGGGFMPQMNGYIFGGTLTGCNTFFSHGYYLVADTLGTFVAGGAINFDTSIVPPAGPAPAPLTEIEASTVQRAVFAEPLGEL